MLPNKRFVQNQSGHVHAHRNNQSKPTPDRSRVTRRRRLLLVGLLLVAFVVWAGCSWMEQHQLIQEQERELEQLKMEVEQTEERHVELTHEIERLHDHEYIAEIARRDYMLSGPGEMIFNVPEK